MLYTYECPQDEEEQAEEQHLPPSPQLLLPISQPTKPVQDLRLARYQSRAVPHHSYSPLEANVKIQIGRLYYDGYPLGNGT